MSKKTVLAGFAIFAMFFGSGNIVFPLSLGRLSGDGWLLSMSGFFITAVILPFLGLLSVVLLQGNNSRFFNLIGKYPGISMQLFIIALLGPFGVIPRCIGVSYGAFKTFSQNIPEPFFIAAFCVVLFGLTLRREHVIPLIGKFLTPIKLLLIGLLIVMGIYSAPYTELPACNAFETIKTGITYGYQTMDLSAAIFFAAAIMGYFKTTGDESSRNLLRDGIQASIIGAILLTTVYISFLFLGSKYSNLTCNVPPEEILPVIAEYALGRSASIIFCVTIIFSCLTTAVALITCWLDTIQNLNQKERFSYPFFLALSCGATFLVASLGFSEIGKILSPILEIIYPIMIIMALIHIIRQLRKPSSDKKWS